MGQSTDGLFSRINMQARLHPASFDFIGWKQEIFPEALAAFQATCKFLLGSKAPLRVGQPAPHLYLNTCKIALGLGSSASPDTARLFFENNFDPFLIEPKDANWGRNTGFLTGYYEPVAAGSLTKTTDFTEPLLARPANHEILVSDSGKHRLPAGLTAALKDTDGTYQAYPDRAEIEDGALGASAKPLVWVRDGIEAFMIHVQGSARIQLPGGKLLRLKYAGRNGHPYRSIGRILVTRNSISARKMSLAHLKQWVRHAGQGPGAPGRLLMQENKSFIFFEIDPDIGKDEGPVGAANINLMPLRSIAIDRNLWPYGLPFWIDASLPWQSPEKSPFRRLMVAHDTGSAILGPARADIFFGTGTAAGALAGGIRHKARFHVLLPKH